MKRIILLFALTSLLANEAQKLPNIPTLNIDSDPTPTVDTTNNTGETQTSQPLRNPFDALVTPK